jgi:hypothetical protein
MGRLNEAGEYLKRIPYAETKKGCEGLSDEFVNRYRRDYPKAVEKLLTDWNGWLLFILIPKSTECI